MSATDVMGLYNQLTVVVIPVVSALVLAIVNFIQHHSHSKRTDALMEKVSAIDGKVLSVDSQLAAQKTNIATGVDALSNIVPGLGTTLAGHSAQISTLSNELTAITVQLEKLKTAIGTAAVTEQKPV